MQNWRYSQPMLYNQCWMEISNGNFREPIFTEKNPLSIYPAFVLCLETLSMGIKKDCCKSRRSLTFAAVPMGLSSKMCKFIFFLTGSFQSCRFCMPESILFILKNACLHLVIHSQLVANQCPVGYRAAIPFFIQFHNPQVECLAYSSLIGECPFFCDFTKA